MRRTYLLSILLISFLSCGIEDYIYFEPVPPGSVRPTSNEYVEVALPDTSGETYFKYYTIYYRIYLSTVDFRVGIPESNFSTINAALYSDYLAIKPYTDVTTDISPSNIDYLFRSRKYNKIKVDGGNIEDLLDKANTNPAPVKLEMNFIDSGANNIPYLVINGNNYQLRRSLDSGTFNPKPDNNFTFRNSSPLRSYANIQDYNKDVQPYSTDPGVSINGAYASLYILKEGTDSNWSPIYSFPTFVGVFRLPVDEQVY